MSSLSAQQRKINGIAGVLVALFALSWAFIYRPYTARLRDLHEELTATQTRIHEAEEMIAAWEARRKAGVRFLDREEDGLEALAAWAREFDIKILNLSARPKVVVRDAAGKPVRIADRTCRRVRVAMETRGSYKGAVRFLTKVREDFPSVTTVEKLRIRKDTADTDQLNIVLELSIYVMSADEPQG